MHILKYVYKYVKSGILFLLSDVYDALAFEVDIAFIQKSFDDRFWLHLNFDGNRQQKFQSLQLKGSKIYVKSTITNGKLFNVIN